MMDHIFVLMLLIAVLAPPAGVLGWKLGLLAWRNGARMPGFASYDVPRFLKPSTYKRHYPEKCQIPSWVIRRKALPEWLVWRTWKRG